MEINRIYLTRSSVCAGDDLDPHRRTIVIKPTSSLKEIMRIVLNEDFLPKISGGKATWTAVSKVPLAVIAQEWAGSQVFLNAVNLNQLDKVDLVNGEIRIQLNYHAQIDPHLVDKFLYTFSLTCPY